MNKLKNTRVYLAGNLENNTDNHINWREYIKAHLSKRNIKTLSPIETCFINQIEESEESRAEWRRLRDEGKFDELSPILEKVVQKDLRLIDLCDFVIINLDLFKPTYGTIHEFYTAISQKKPIFLIVNDKKKTPFWILGTFKHKYIYESVDDVLKIIDDIDDGKIELENEKWKILLENLR